MNRLFPNPFSRSNLRGYSDSHILAKFLLISLLTGIILISGCTGAGKEPITGAWEWSDGRGYIESYTFNPDHSFFAQALGSEFNGTWESILPGHYQVTYHNRNDTQHHETLTEQVLYDSKTDAIYFPAHSRVV